MADPTEDGQELVYATRIPADVGQPDRVLGPLTARQAAIIAGTAGVLWLGFYASRPVMAPLAYLALVAPVAAVMTALALGRRDAMSMDRFALAAWRHWRSPRRQVSAPEGIPPLPDIIPTTWAHRAGRPPAALHMPCRRLLDAGVVDLGRDGHAALASCSTVNFDLCTGAEQQALTSAFARWLNSLTGPAQILIRAHRLNIEPLADRLVEMAPALPHPALENAARAHAEYLRDLAAHSNLLTRQVLLVVREPAATTGRAPGAGPARVRQRIAEAARALAPAEITAVPLDAPRTASAINAAHAPQTTPADPEDREEGEGAWCTLR